MQHCFTKIMKSLIGQFNCNLNLVYSLITFFRDTICKQACDIVEAAYAKVYAEVSKSYSDTLMTRTPEQLKILLS